MDKDEVDGFDEGKFSCVVDDGSFMYAVIIVIYPCDYEQAGHLVDDVRRSFQGDIDLLILFCCIGDA